MFTTQPKMYIWATFVRKYVTKNYQISPNLVTLIIIIIIFLLGDVPKQMLLMGSGCGAVGRAVAPIPEDPGSTPAIVNFY